MIDNKIRARTIALMVSILLMGILLGATVYSHIVYFPVYLSALPESAVLVAGPYALHEERFWLLIHPVAVLSLIISLALNWKMRARRKLIAITLIAYVVVIVITQVYFLPELRAFQNSPNSNVSPAEWFARGRRWQYFSWIRGIVMGLIIVPLLLALRVPED